MEWLKTWIKKLEVTNSEFKDQIQQITEDLPKLLNAIKFVDRIIFGKLNYNVVSSKFKDNISFYEYCADKVIEFCEKNNIERHIKCGTRKTYNIKTESIFRKACAQPIVV